MDITRRLKEHQPSVQPEVKEVTSLLHDFSALWKQLKLAEKKALLKVIFVAVYFDQNVSIRRVMANSPFDQVLGEIYHSPKILKEFR